MEMKTWTVKLYEDELKALIQHHTIKIAEHDNPTTDMSERLHNLVKRLHKETPDISDDPRPEETVQQQQVPLAKSTW
jgi:hypothetical protein